MNVGVGVANRTTTTSKESNGCKVDRVLFAPSLQHAHTDEERAGLSLSPWVPDPLRARSTLRSETCPPNFAASPLEPCLTPLQRAVHTKYPEPRQAVARWRRFRPEGTDFGSDMVGQNNKSDCNKGQKGPASLAEISMQAEVLAPGENPVWRAARRSKVSSSSTLRHLFTVL